MSRCEEMFTDAVIKKACYEYANEIGTCVVSGKYTCIMVMTLQPRTAATVQNTRSFIRKQKKSEEERIFKRWKVIT